MRACERNQIGTAGRENCIHLIGGRDVADAHRRDVGFVADLVGVRRLEHAAEDRFGVVNGLPGRDIDQVTALARKGTCDFNRVFTGNAAVFPVSCRKAHRHRAIERPDLADCAEDFERKAKAIVERAAIFVAALVRER